MRRLRTFYKGFQENILKQNTEIVNEKEQKFDFKGQKVQISNDRTPQITREQIDQFSRLDPPLEPQRRDIRLKNIFYMSVYILWFSGMVMFIMYRLKGDDLKQMEKEAEERINLRDSMKQQRQDSKIPKQN